MTKFNANDTVIYTDAEGRKIDTFVIFDTDAVTGLTHINHENRRVPTSDLVMHAITVPGFHLPMQDAFSFEIFKKLREKYTELDATPVKKLAKATPVHLNLLAKAS